MKISLNWLRRYVDLDWDADEISRRLTEAGIEVEGREELHAAFSGVIVARVLETRPHPGADRLKLAKVDTGSEVLDLVCGAPNCRAGLVVALAPIGATVGDMKLKKAKIRGEVSFGMLCSAKELGLSEAHDGILELNDEFGENPPLGRPLVEVLPIEDTVFELSLTANRGDCLSHIGVARELAALAKVPLKMPAADFAEVDEDTPVPVTIQNSDRCARYVGRVIHGLKVCKSPFWMQRLLESVGVRAINNLVDVTNFVLFEYGQPLHAFDLRNLRGRKIEVRTAQAGEQMATLDGVTRTFTADDLLICDGEGPVAVAGVMGGLDSEVKDDTTDLFLESAWFQPSSIRLTARRLGLHSESSHRFERDIDCDMADAAAKRAIALFCELSAPGSTPSVPKVYTDERPRLVKRPEIEFRTAETTRRLGVEIPADEQRAALEALGFKTRDAEAGSQEHFFVQVPAWRGDCHEGADLVEEIARYVGYDRIPTAAPRLTTKRKGPEDLVAERIAQIRKFLSIRGFDQALNFSFLSREVQDLFCATPGLALQNPLSEDHRVLRQLMVPRLCLNVAFNQRHGNKDVSFFEIGRVFTPNAVGEQPNEFDHLAICWGSNVTHHWSGGDRPLDFFDIKGLVEDLAQFMRCPVTDCRPIEVAYLHPGASAVLYCGDKQLGLIGELHPETARALDIQGPILLAELDLAVLAGEAQVPMLFEAYPRFPAVARDLALKLKRSVSSAEVLEAVRELQLDNVDSVQIFDEYHGSPLANDERSLGLSIVYRAPNRTLTDDEVGALHSRLVEHLEAKFDAAQR